MTAEPKPVEEPKLTPRKLRGHRGKDRPVTDVRCIDCEKEGVTTKRPAPHGGGGGAMNPAGPIVAGTAVILTGESLKHALDAVLIAARGRTLNGLPNSATHLELAKAFTAAMSAARQCDVAEPEPLQHYPQQQPTVTIRDAAQQLNLSHRQTQRLAPKLAGKLIAGRWLLDQDAIDEHKKGQKWTETA